MTVQCPVCDRRLRVRKDSPSRKGKCPCGAIIVLASSVAVPHRRKERLRTLHRKPASRSDTTQISLDIVMPPPPVSGRGGSKSQRKAASLRRKGHTPTPKTEAMKAIWPTPVTARPATEKMPAVKTAAVRRPRARRTAAETPTDATPTTLTPVDPTPTTVRTPSVFVSVPTDNQIVDGSADEPSDERSTGRDNTASQVLLLILLVLLLGGVLWLQWPLV